MTTYLPKYFTKKAITLYAILLVICSVLVTRSMLPLLWITTGLVSVIGFFSYGNLLSRKWKSLPMVVFEKKVFLNALIIRVLYVLSSYLLYTLMTGQPFEFDTADAMGYHVEAKWLLLLLSLDQLEIYTAYTEGNISDVGYVAYLALIYKLFGDFVLPVRLIKALLSAFTCVMITRIATRNFGDSAGKIAGILAMLTPNLIYYCGLHVKETEMIFLTVFFIERADLLIRSRHIKWQVLVTVGLLGLSLFLFRTVLAATLFASLTLGFLLYSGRGLKVSLAKKFAFGIVILGFSLFLFQGKIGSEIEQYWGDRETNQSKSMKSRAQKIDGNKLAVYGSAALFAPMILFAPFPTLINIETQQNQMLLNGGYFTRNVYVFFVLIALYALYKARKLREHLLLLAFLLSYLGILAASKFALSERFHLPILPMLIVLAAYGITQLDRKHVKYYVPYLTLVALIILAWNLFKVAGRGGL